MAEIALVAAGVVWSTLLGAGVVHLRRPRRLAAALAARGWPVPLRMPAAVALAVTETGLGALGLGGIAGAAPARPLLAVGAAVLFAGFAVDAARLVRSGADVPCGCGVAEVPVNVWVVVRAACYAVLAGVAVAARTTLTELAPAELSVVVAAAGTIGTLLWLLPRTLAIPRGFVL